MLEIKKISFGYHKSEPVLRNFSLSLEKNKIMGIAGESGSGKSTLLSLIYGLFAPASGEILFEKQRVKNLNDQLIAGHPDMQLAGQLLRLQPSVSIIEQIKYKLLRYEKSYREKKALELLDLVGLTSKKDAFSTQISGGQQQLVNLCCALAEEPKLLLLDEPFNNLDQSSKERLKDYLNSLKSNLGMSTIIVSHDPIDLLSVSDEVTVLKNGKIIQRDLPENIYFQPKNNYVAQLFGEINIIRKKEKKIFIRPSKVQLSAEKKNGFLVGEIISKTFQGSHYLYLVKTKFLGEIYVSTTNFLSQKNIWVKL